MSHASYPSKADCTLEQVTGCQLVVNQGEAKIYQSMKGADCN